MGGRQETQYGIASYANRAWPNCKISPALAPAILPPCGGGKRDREDHSLGQAECSRTVKSLCDARPRTRRNALLPSPNFTKTLSAFTHCGEVARGEAEATGTLAWARIRGHRAETDLPGGRSACTGQSIFTDYLNVRAGDADHSSSTESRERFEAGP